MLYFLEKDDLPEKRVERIVKASKVLETRLGYRTLDPAEKYNAALGTTEDGYHARTVWPFEQAFIHIAARKFGLPAVTKVSERIVRHLDTFPELFIIDDSGYRSGGSQIQLWTVAAKHYFQTYFANQKNRIV
jgi:glycogen debranching enzyme